VVKLLFREKEFPLHQKLLDLLPTTFEGLYMSPGRPVTLPEFQRKMAKIPLEATSFFWVYSAPAKEIGPAQQAVHWRMLVESRFSQEEMVDPLVRLIQCGGFCYLDESQRVCGVTTISHKEEIFALQFAEPDKLLPEEVDAVPEQIFRPVTLEYLASRGAEKYAWFGPNESFDGFNIGRDHGSFVYQMKAATRTLIRFPVI